MEASLKSIPKPTADMPVTVARVINPMRDAIERRFLGSSDERVITRGELKRLGILSDAQLNELDG